MVKHETNELFFGNLEIPEDALLGEEGKGLGVIFEGLNAERTLIAAECIGDGYWFLDRAPRYAKERKVFGRAIGQNQGIQFPLAEAFIALVAASLMRWRACEKIDARQNAGAEANMAKYLAATASREAGNACLQTHGGFGFACEYDVERKFRETRLYQVAPPVSMQAPAGLPGFPALQPSRCSAGLAWPRASRIWFGTNSCAGRGGCGKFTRRQLN